MQTRDKRAFVLGLGVVLDVAWLTLIWGGRFYRSMGTDGLGVLALRLWGAGPVLGALMVSAVAWSGASPRILFGAGSGRWRWRFTLAVLVAAVGFLWAWCAVPIPLELLWPEPGATFLMMVLFTFIAAPLLRFDLSLCLSSFSVSERTWFVTDSDETSDLATAAVRRHFGTLLRPIAATVAPVAADIDRSEFAHLLEGESIDHLGWALPEGIPADVLQVCRDLRLNVTVLDPTAVAPWPVRSVPGIAPHPAQDLIRAVFDRLLALFLCTVLAPLMLLIAIAVRATSTGPALFFHRRHGLHGRPFHVLKFRTMRVGAEERQPDMMRDLPADVAFKPEDDPRVTRLGRWLRRASLDELPQLFNVCRGQMSLVGPRPLAPHETAALDAHTRRVRHRVKPGITGLWQVSGRSLIRDMGTRMAMDVEYVERQSLLLDFRILLRTVPAVLTARGAQ
jgi:lipopolysaccharide/colanic/teichoic acid biosynthesis glycosyltransferase